MIGTDSMHALLTRRKAITLLGTSAASLLVARFSPAMAQGAQDSGDLAFVRQFSDQLIAVLNGSGSLADKRAATLPLVNQNVDVDGIARFALGRYWHLATPTQQQQFVELFHRVLLKSITDKLGEYQGVTVSLGAVTPHGAGRSAVSSTINRPGQPATKVDWVIDHVGGTPKVGDVIGEGVSLSITERQDYSSYLQRNNNNISALLAAMQRQATRNG